MNTKIKRISQEEMAEQQQQLLELAALLACERPLSGRAPGYFIRTFGCQQNENDSEKLAGILEQAGYRQVPDYESADLVLINTCSIRENADRRLFGHLGRLKALKKNKKNLLVGVCGCLPTQEEQAQKIRRSFSFVNLLFGPQDIWKLPSMLLQAYQGSKIYCPAGAENSVSEGLPLVRQRRHRALVTIMHGCNNFCSYCVVPYARGRERSRYAADILQECHELVRQGFPEILLLGQNVNAWGRDLFPDNAAAVSQSLETTEADRLALDAVCRGEKEARSFAELLLAIAEIPNLHRLRYMSSHPRDFNGQLIEALGRSEIIENHLHLPLQSGSDDVLRRMNRPYDMKRFEDIVARLRRRRPEISLTTDIIVGFPGETEEDFMMTTRAVERLRFDSAFMFIYSPRPGTAAASMEQLPEALCHERFNRLVALQDQLCRESLSRLVGRELDILIEGVSEGETNFLSGRDSAFHLLNISVRPSEHFPVEAFLENGRPSADYFAAKRAKVRVLRARSYSAEAELIQLLDG